MEQTEQEALAEGWQALRDACRTYHRAAMKGSRGGGAATCVCGNGCGGSKACGMLAALRQSIRFGSHPPGSLFEKLREVV